MSVRKDGIYMTAKWDYSHDKVHFLYDGFECDTKQLESFKGSPIFIPEFQNPETAVDYEFVPLLEVLMSPDFVTDVKKVEPEPDLEPTSVRGKVAWQWNARLKYTAKSESYALDVYYSIPTETSVSIPLRVVQYIDEEATAVLQEKLQS
ncbi:unnamed protein product [Oikopleura dioica]|uniref:Uncharacterized protein n=1 Tax=Oikopleura dioica TaxID=34765 RepID=E4WYX6_OIKDI|nr:unnamed protein product [Oikopleura dioica]